MAGVNRELWPLVEMTYSTAHAHLTPESPKGRPLFRSWMLLLGIIPIDYDDLALVALEPGRGFDEVSQLFSMRHWHHRRTLVPTPQGCIVRDEIDCVPRWQWTGPLLVKLFWLAFVLRHRNLRRFFGAASLHSLVPPQTKRSPIAFSGPCET